MCVSGVSRRQRLLESQDADPTYSIGWTISRYGLVVPDTSNDAMKVENFEKGTSRDNRASGTPLFFDTDDYSSDEAFNSDKTPEVYESISNEDEPSLDFDFAPQYEPSDWTRPPPPLPAAAALALLQYVQARGHMNGAFEEAVLYLQSTGCPSDLVNESLVLWLFVSTISGLMAIANRLKSIMRQPYWDLVDLSYASRLCAAQLEDRIEYILETEKSQQASNDFDMRKADSRAQNTLAAYVKRLCKRETVAKSARRYFPSKQKDLQWEPRDEYAPSIYHHRANKAEYKEPASVSPELSILPSIEKKELTQPTRKQPSRHCRGTLTNSVI